MVAATLRCYAERYGDMLPHTLHTLLHYAIDITPIAAITAIAVAITLSYYDSAIVGLMALPAPILTLLRCRHTVIIADRDIIVNMLRLLRYADITRHWRAYAWLMVTVYYATEDTPLLRHTLPLLRHD